MRQPWATAHGALFVNAPLKRVSVFIDGFNVYHSIVEINAPHLLWVDLRKLANHFCDPTRQVIGDVWYFSAYATHRPHSLGRHVEYVKALESVNVRCVMGSFKNKDRRCPACTHRWTGHEEKESDVNFAIHLFHEAQQGNFDEAFLITRDSDLVPPVRLAKSVFPGKIFKILAPPERRHSKELLQVTDKNASIKRIHVERSLFPQMVLDANGNVLATRPARYDPPPLPAPAPVATP